MHSFKYTKPDTVVAVIVWRSCDPSQTQSQNRIVMSFSPTLPQAGSLV